MSAAADRARGPQPLWAAVPPAARAHYLRRAAQAILDEVDALADLLAAEAQVPRTEALLAELLPSVAGLHELADAGPDALADRRLGRAPLRRSFLFQRPVGVVGIRGGDGSPWAEPVLEAAAALLAGNGVVWAGHAALGQRFDAVLGRAGLPDELLTVADDLEGCDATRDSGIAGPKATMLVFPDAPLERVVAGAVWAAFARGGHGVASVGRIVTLTGHAGTLLRALEPAVARIVVGDPRDPATEISAPAAPRVVRGDAPGGDGPVLTIVEATDEAAAIALCAGAPAVSVWAGHADAAERIARALDVELTWVNEHGDAAVAAPVRIARHARVRQLASRSVRLRYARWLPYDPTLVRASETATRILYGRESERLGVVRSGGVSFARAAARMVRDRHARRRAPTARCAAARAAPG